MHSARRWEKRCLYPDADAPRYTHRAACHPEEPVFWATKDLLFIGRWLNEACNKKTKNISFIYPITIIVIKSKTVSGVTLFHIFMRTFTCSWNTDKQYLQIHEIVTGGARFQVSACLVEKVVTVIIFKVIFCTDTFLCGFLFC